jgi:phenylpropionate dioxygenase-like ring-hydroxylating dioxygenase large terminal subunit
MEQAAIADIRRSSWRPAIPASNRTYPMNCWWVAAFSDEIGSDLLGRWILDTPVLLYRTEDGHAVALEDRCPHRGTPLSLGCRKGDAVQCGYHGFTFDTDGACIDVPSMKAPPRAVQVRSFPIIEHPPFLWIYLGDPDALDRTPPPPTVPSFTDDRHAMVKGRTDMAGNFMLLKENVLDLTHFGYVHKASFEISDWMDPPKTRVDGDIVYFEQEFERTALPPLYAGALGLPAGTLYNRYEHGCFASPALQIAYVEFHDPDLPARQDPTGTFVVVHATTPINDREMLYFWVLTRDHGTSPELMHYLKDLTEIGFAEDQRVIEAVQAMANRDPLARERKEISVPADAAGVLARRALQRWMERETG